MNQKSINRSLLAFLAFLYARGLQEVLDEYINCSTEGVWKGGQYFPYSSTAAFYLFQSSSLSYTSAAPIYRLSRRAMTARPRDSVSASVCWTCDWIQSFCFFCFYFAFEAWTLETSDLWRRVYILHISLLHLFKITSHDSRLSPHICFEMMILWLVACSSSSSSSSPSPPPRPPPPSPSPLPPPPIPLPSFILLSSPPTHLLPIFFPLLFLLLLLYFILVLSLLLHLISGFTFSFFFHLSHPVSLLLPLSLAVCHSAALDPAGRLSLFMTADMWQFPFVNDKKCANYLSGCFAANQSLTSCVLAPTAAMFACCASPCACVQMCACVVKSVCVCVC